MKKVLPVGAVLIPDDAKVVFSGILFDVYQWNQKQYDGSHKIFEMLKREDTIQVVAVKDDKLVLIKDQQPGRPAQIYPPRGRVDKSDASWLDAAKREMKEETGMTFKNWRLVEVAQPAAKIEWFVVTYVATDFEAQKEQHLDVGEQIDIWLETAEKVRELTLGGDYVSYLRPFFARITDLQSLLALPEFSGQIIDRP
jgi:ADP-ribose pyrophosphatase YjhB (NUDIX family)